MAAATVVTTPTTPESTWQQSTLHSNIKSKPKIQPTIVEQQSTLLPPSTPKVSTTNMHDLMETLNELCYRGFDELNALIQEQRWVNSLLLITIHF